MMGTWGPFAVGVGWALAVATQSFVLAHSPAHTLWVGCFIALGESLALLLQISENPQNTSVGGFWSGLSVLYKGTLRAIICGIFLYCLKEIGYLRCIFLYSAFALGADFFFFERWRQGLSFLGLTIFSAGLLYGSCLIKCKGDLLCVTLVFVGTFISLLINYCCHDVSLAQHCLWRRVFEHFVASVELAICGWISTSSQSFVAFPYSWPLFSCVLVMSGFGKSFYDAVLRTNMPSFSIIGGLISSIGFCFVSCIFWGYDKCDYFLLFGGGILFFCTVNSVRGNSLVSILDDSFYLVPSRNVGGIFVSNLIRFCMSNDSERRLVIFFFLTIFVMILELLYGFSANSLGLVSDSFHMLLDSVSIAVGLFAAFAASLPGDEKTYPFGLGRYRELGGFINGVLLLFIALFIVVESVERLISPPEIEAAYLIHVSAIGLLVNLVGVAFFHNVDSCGHSHGGCTGGTDHNLRGVYLHILADLVGSVSVMISSVIISFTHVRIVDPLFSLISCIFIAVSAFPLLEKTGKVLLLTGHPYDKESFFYNAIADIKRVSGVINVEKICVWTHSTVPSESVYCAVRLTVEKSVCHSDVRHLVKQFLRRFLFSETRSHCVNVVVHIE